MGNLTRVLPGGCDVNLGGWGWADTFFGVQERSRLTREEMLKSLNCGVGMALVCSPKHVAEVEAIVRAHNHVAMALGRVDLQSGAKLHDPASAESRVVY